MLWNEETQYLFIATGSDSTSPTSHKIAAEQFRHREAEDLNPKQSSHHFGRKGTRFPFKVEALKALIRHREHA
jgi:hypothetical protein